MRFTKYRKDWEDPLKRVSGPMFLWGGIDTIAIHYTAADNLIDGDPGENWDNMPGYLRSIQASYLAQRGYSIGYNAAVDQRGWSWELRGDTYKCAANSGWNDRTFAILVLVDGNDSAWPGAVDAVRDLVAQVRERRPGARVVGHRDIGSTACPGLGLYNQIVSGVFEPVPVTNEDEDMKPVITRWGSEPWDVIIWSDPVNGNYRWRGVPNASDLVAAGMATDRRGFPLPTALRDHPIMVRDEA